jgi:glyoxylase-like metal-dependent hydrolase (beta-lactamase superfamily II)
MFLVVTHPHSDHLTGLVGLKEEFPDALVVAAEGAPEFVSHPKALDAMMSEDRHISEFLASQGFRPSRPPLEDPPSLGDCLVAKHGDEMDLGGVTLRFVVAQGHSPANINVHIPELEALIVSDSLGVRFMKGGFYPAFFTGYTEYVDTLDRLDKLDPRILGMGHQGPIREPHVRKAIEEARRAAVEVKEKILATSDHPERLARELFEDWYRDELLASSPTNIANCCKLLVKRAME